MKKHKLSNSSGESWPGRKIRASAKELHNKLRSNGALRCEFCHTWFSSFHYLRTHLKKHARVLKNYRKIFLCKYCGKVFCSNPLREEHYVRAHRCHYCSSVYPYKEKLITHKESHGNVVQRGANIQSVTQSSIFRVITAFENCFRVFRYDQSEDCIKLTTYLHNKIIDMRSAITRMLASIGPLKLQIVCHVKFERKDFPTGLMEYFDAYLNSELRIVLNTFEIDTTIRSISRYLNNLVEGYERHSSNWRLCMVLSFDLRINKYKALGASCYVPTPRKVYAKKCVINVLNQDARCFMWAVLASLFPANSNKNNVYSYTKNKSKLQWDDDWFPMTLDKIVKFEELNQVAVNVFFWDASDGLCPLQISNNNYKVKWRTVNLLHLQSPNCSHAHYACITDLGKLIGKQNHHRKVLCFHCLSTFPAKTFLPTHMELCKKFKL